MTQNRYEIKIEGSKIILIDNLTGDTHYGEWYVGENGQKYVKSNSALSTKLISKYWVNREDEKEEKQQGLTKEQIKKWVSQYIEDVEDAIEDFNEENSTRYGSKYVVMVELEEAINWEKLDQNSGWTKLEEIERYKIYEVKVIINSSGMQSVENAKKIAEALENAIRFAEEINIDIKNNLEDNSRERLYKYGMRMRPAGLGHQPIGFIKLVTYEDYKTKPYWDGDGFKPYWDILIYNRKLTDEELKKYEMDYLGEAGA